MDEDSRIDRRTLIGKAAAVGMAAALDGVGIGRIADAAAAPRKRKPIARNADLAFTDATGLARLVAKKRISATELARFFLGRIERLNPELNAFVAVMEEQALAQAKALDRRQARGHGLRPLHGVPVVIKDEDDVRGMVTTFGGRAFSRPCTADGAVAARLRAAGAVILGKTRMPEFGIWPFTESETFGHTRNPWDLTKSTAGSSGGTAAAVAAGLAPFGVGGDGGGSIRLPSSWCGLFGLKPQLGRVSAAPNSHLWRNLGVIGCLARTVRDSALFYDITSGPTPGVDRYTAGAWSTTLSAAVAKGPGRLRIAISTRPPSSSASVDEVTANALHRLGKTLADLGHDVVEADPEYPDSTLAFVPQWFASVREEAARADRPDLLERKTKQMVAEAVAFSTEASEDLAVQQAEATARAVYAFFDAHDILITPTTLSSALPVGQMDGVDFHQAALKAGPVAAWTVPWNVCGGPAAAIPTGFDDAGMPLSAQIIGPPNSEPRIMALAAQIESAQPWAQRRPPVG